MGDLPRPATATEMYLSAILDELRSIRAQLTLEPTGSTNLREPISADALMEVKGIGPAKAKEIAERLNNV